MDYLVGFASSVSRDLVCGALNQLRYLRSFNNSVKKLEQEEGDLIVTRDDVQKYVEHAKRKTRETSGLVDKWLQDAISNIGKVNRLLEEARTKNMCCFGYSPNWIWRYRMGKKLANKVVHLEKFIDEGRKYVLIDILSGKCINFESRQSTYEQLLDAVKNNDVSMIGLYGMGGCGKTTLAMEVMKLVEAEHLFEKVLFVPVSSSVDVPKIQEKIASSLQFQFPETEEMQRAQRLCWTLIQEKNIFIILDDVWEKLDFGRIGIPSSEHHKGCKILITSRSEAVCTLMDCQRKIYLPILTDEEAWTLFQNKALITEATSDTLKEIGRLISNECKGLPVAIAAVSCSLKGKAETEWRVAFNKLRHSKPISIERGLTNPYKCLQLSYDNLDYKEAKSLFLLCSVFPEDFEIPIEMLTRCAIGLGVVGEVDSYEEARSEVIAAKIKLVSSCLLLDADHERVKMHDIVRDMAHTIAQNENKKIKCEVEIDVTVEQNSVRYIWCSKFPNDLDCSNLEFLRLKTKMTEFDGIFKRMGTLKVLILVNDDDGKTTFSTISFKTLTNLRCLFIENYELSDFSCFGGMKNLQSLSLYNCLLPSFPELQTDVAITLKLLELKGCDIKLKNFEVMKRIPLLEELYIINIRGQWRDANSEDNIEFFKTFSIPETLQRYGIVLGSYRFGHYNDDDIYVHGRTLVLNHFDISNELIKGLAKKANHLFVRNIHGGAKNIIPDIFQIEGGGLDELNKLEIHNSEELECLIDTRSHSSEVVTLFSKLHTLGIGNMRNLRVIWHCRLPANGPFENLEKFGLSDCPRLKFLFTYVLARNFVKLKILKILRCDELKYILADEFTTGHPVQIFQNLQEVEITSCRELKHIFPGNIVGGLTQLKVVEIEECDKLDQIIGDIVPSTDRDKLIEKGTLSSLTNLRITYCGKLGSIFTASTAKTLTSLEELYIGGCKSLKDIVTHERVNKNQEESIVEDEPDCQSDISIFQSLKKIDIHDCELLEGIFPVSFVGELNDITNKEAADLKDFSSRNNTQIELPALQVLELQEVNVYYCPELKHIFPANIVGCLGQLKVLKIERCDMLDQIIGDIVSLAEQDRKEELDEIVEEGTLSSLASLEIKRCGKLGSIFTASIAKTLTSLEELFIEDCKSLKDMVTHESIVGDEHDISIFQSLKKLHISECDLLEGIFPVSFVGGMMKFNDITNKETADLKDFSSRNNTQSEDIQNHLPTLQTLNIKHSDAKRIFCLNEHEMIGQQVSLRLENLELYNLPQMAYIWVGPKNSLTLQHLTTLEIRDCGKLEVIFPKSVVRCLPELKNVTIRECMELKQIIEEDQFNLHSIDGGSEVEEIIGCDKEASNNYLAFPNLEKLKIIECAKLEVVFPKYVLRCLSKLNVLVIRNCKELKHIMEEDESSLLSRDGGSELEEIIGCDKKSSKKYFALTNLEILEIIECAKLEVVFPKSVLRCLPKLNVLVIRNCKELKHIMEEDESNLLSIDGGSELKEIIGCDKEASKNYFALTNLEKLEIIDCAILEIVFPKSVLRCLPKLNVLVIRNCKELKHIMEEDESNLLSVDGGSELKEIIGCDKEASKNYFAFPNLEKLEIIECAKLEIVFPKSVLRCFPKLKLLKIRKCKELRQIIEGNVEHKKILFLFNYVSQN